MTRQARIGQPAGTDVAIYDTTLWPELLDQDPEAVMARFAERFVKAENLDELFNVLEGNSSKDMIGRKVEIRSVKWAPYESDSGIIPNAICTATDLDTGELTEFATTGGMLTMFIRRAELIGALPFQARIAGRKTRSGQTALNFERV
jgi:hypothetical protein